MTSGDQQCLLCLRLNVYLKRKETRLKYITKKKVIKFTCYLFVFIYGSNESSSDTVCRKVHLYFQQDKRLYVESTLISITRILNIHI